VPPREVVRASISSSGGRPAPGELARTSSATGAGGGSSTTLPDVTLVNRTLAPRPPGLEPVDATDSRLFAREGSAEGCASGACLPEPVATPASAAPLERWKAAVEAVRTASPRHGKSLSHGRFLSMEPGTIKLFFPNDAAFHRSTVFGMSRQLIEEELSKHFGRPTKVMEDTSPNAHKAAAPSIAEDEARQTAARHTAIDARVHQHPAIKNVLRILGGTVEHVQYLEPVREAPSALPRVQAPEDE
jgi:hypothetical protein